jgi:uncharacterized LabA/DUF88 family protein
MQDNSSENNNRKIAMLIDGDNAQASLIEKTLAETSKYGFVTIRQIYGDWTTTEMNSWKEYLHVYAFQPMQQFRYTTRKNATDSAMIIDAMDILRDNLVEGFCIVSSDSDYTRLATRIRKSGIFVMGIGKKDTPQSFVKACDIFTYTENLTSTVLNVDIKSNTKIEDLTECKSLIEKDENPLQKIIQAYEMTVQDDGWALLSDVGKYIHKIDPSFDYRSYNCGQLSQLIKRYSDIIEWKKKDSKLY